MYFNDVLKTNMEDLDIILLALLFDDKDQRDNDYLKKNYSGLPFKYTGVLKVDTPVRRFVASLQGNKECREVLKKAHKLHSERTDFYEKSGYDKLLEDAKNL